MKNKLSSASGAIAFIVAILGTAFYFLDLPGLMFLCSALVIADSIIQVLFGGQNGFTTEILASIIGFIVSRIFQINIIETVSVAICIECVLLSGIGYIMVLIYFVKLKK